MVYVWNLPQKFGTGGLGQHHVCLLSLRNAVAEGAKMPDCCGVSLLKMRLSKYGAKILPIAWWGLAWGVAVCCHEQESQLCVGVDHKETWDVPVALQVCLSVLWD